MVLSHNSIADLAFDTAVLRTCGNDYAEIAEELRKMSTKLDKLLIELKDSGWTTPAGTAFHKMVETNWEENISKYADLLDTLNDILHQAADKYDLLVTDYIEKTKI